MTCRSALRPSLSGDVNGDDVAAPCSDHDDCPNLGFACLPPDFCVNDASEPCMTDLDCEERGGRRNLSRSRPAAPTIRSQACTIDDDCTNLGQWCIDGSCILNLNILDNSFHVVSDYSFDLPTVIDGLTVQHGSQAVRPSDAVSGFNGGGGILAGFSGGRRTRPSDHP